MLGNIIGDKNYYSPDEIADLLGLHVRTICRYIREWSAAAPVLVSSTELPQRR
ncbi:helix-turn-helix domain-containing protein [Saccharospirillum mangrovi]|uniref:helix-turn-helix domain-containing protein n=1 Tax=Saccharospirillum mangrovi TaxID=2161747 RepID=UPI0018E4E1F7